MEQLKEKEHIRKSCLAFGAYDTARKLRDAPSKLKLLIEYLITNEVTEPAYLIGKTFLSEEELVVFEDSFKEINPAITRNSVFKKYTEALTGVSVNEFKKEKRLASKAARKEISVEKKGKKDVKPKKDTKDKRDNKTKREPKESKQKKERINEIEVPAVSKEGIEFITIDSAGYSSKNVFHIVTERGLELTMDHFSKQTKYAIDIMNIGEIISTITLASEEQVAVLNISALKAAGVFKFIREQLRREDLEIIAYSFAPDAFVLGKAIKFDPEEIKNVFDLTDIHTQDGQRVQFSKMSEEAFGKAIAQYCRKLNWLETPLTRQMNDFAALNGIMKLKLFNHFMETEEAKNKKAFIYVEPEGIRERVEKATKKAEDLKMTRRSREPRSKRPERKSSSSRRDTDKPRQRSNTRGRLNRGGRRGGYASRSVRFAKVEKKD